MSNRILPQVNSPVRLGRTDLLQNTTFTKTLDRTMWRMKSSRLTVFLRKHSCENKEKRISIKIPYLSFV